MEQARKKHSAAFGEGSGGRDQKSALDRPSLIALGEPELDRRDADGGALAGGDREWSRPSVARDVSDVRFDRLPQAAGGGLGHAPAARSP